MAKENFGFYSALPAVIAASGSLSAAIVMERQGIARIIVPTGWTAANLTFQVSEDGVTFYELYNDTGTAISVTVPVTTGCALNLQHTTWGMGFNYIKIRSGTAGSPVNQSSQANLTVIRRPL